MIKQRETTCEIEIAKDCEFAGFMRRVPIEMYYRTIHDMDDGFEGKTRACREYTLPREDQDSEIIAWICGHTKIGPVLQVQTACRLDQYGIEIQIPSTSGDGSTSWITISRGSNRHVEELQDNDPDYFPESRE